VLEMYILLTVFVLPHKEKIFLQLFDPLCLCCMMKYGLNHNSKPQYVVSLCIVLVM